MIYTDAAKSASLQQFIMTCAIRNVFNPCKQTIFKAFLTSS